MLAPLTTPISEWLTPHDLVTYFRCPHEMELVRSEHLRANGGPVPSVRTPADVVPLRHSPLFAPPLGHLVVNEGRLDLTEKDILVYEDEGEDDLPMLFPPERVRPDVRFGGGHATLSDPVLAMRGRPDLIIQRGDGSLIPVESQGNAPLCRLPRGPREDVRHDPSRCRVSAGRSGLRA